MVDAVRVVVFVPRGGVVDIDIEPAGGAAGGGEESGGDVVRLRSGAEIVAAGIVKSIRAVAVDVGRRWTSNEARGWRRIVEDRGGSRAGDVLRGGPEDEEEGAEDRRVSL